FDAPAGDQPYGAAAAARLQELIGDGADCECRQTDTAGRSLCVVLGTDAQNVAVTMLEEGLGCVDFAGEDDADEQEALRIVSRDARAARRGIWSTGEPGCPKI
ncbi:MAG TPA: thermonuclease family protein, partial [Azonexus sp.]|nr:thermonuclease family protein [Azonexus sp.]